MKSSSVLLIFASIVVVGCAGTSPLAPDSVSGSSARSVVSAAPGSTSQAFFPPINPPDISCPSDAPQIRVGSLDLRMEVDFTEIKGAYAYEIQISRYTGRNVYEPFKRLQIPAPANRAEWYAESGRYLVKVRTMNCGGLGNWSEVISHAIGEAELPPPVVQPEPPQGPQCMTTGCEPPKGPQCMTNGCEPPKGPQCGVMGCEPPQGPQCGMMSCEPPQGPQCGNKGCD